MTIGKHKNPAITRDFTNGFNRFMYFMLTALSVYFLVRGDVSTAMSNLGIALIFDPFQREMPFLQRPLYQRIWLFAHLSGVFILLGTVLLG